MKTIGNLLAGVCAALFVFAGTASLFLFNIERRAFAPEPYKRAFEKLGLYDRMPAILAATVFPDSAPVGQAQNPILALMTRQGAEPVIAFLLPPAELRAMTDGALDSIFAYINGEADSAAIPLSPFKNRLTGPAGTEAVLGLLHSQPACTAEQLFQMTLGALTGGGFALCSPPPEAVDLFKPFIQAQLQFTASIVPDSITIIRGDRSGTPNDPRRRLNSLRAWMKISPALPVVLLLAVTILAVRNWITFFNWWGYSLLITGAITFLLALVGAPLVGWIIRVLIETQAGQIVSIALADILRETTSAVAVEILRPILFQGSAVADLGVVMVLAGLLVRSRAQLSTP